MTAHTVLVVVHAGAATLALILGVAALRSPRWVVGHAVAVVVMTVALAWAVVIGRDSAGATATGVFAALCCVATIMSLQAVLAVRRRPRPHSTTGPATASVPRDYRAAIGFTCIGLVTGFVAVTVTRSTANPLLWILLPVATVLLGRLALERMLAAQASPSVSDSDGSTSAATADRTASTAASRVEKPR